MQVSVPGRADFLNTHQDYKGLPAVPVGLDLRTRIDGAVTNGTKVSVKSMNLEEEGQPAWDEFDIRDIEYEEIGWFGNYIRATVNALMKAGHSRKIKGARMTITSDVPMGAGLGSSGALEVATAKFFDAAFRLNLSRREIAEYSYLAERNELRVPCGRLDQYASSYGGVILLDTQPPFRVEELPFKSFFLAVLDSGIRHSTTEIHPERQRELDEGLTELLRLDLPETIRATLSAKHADVKWKELKETELQDYLRKINQRNANRIRYTMRAQCSTAVALKILRQQTVDAQEVAALTGENSVTRMPHHPRSTRSLISLGAIINYQHELLRDLYEVSLPRLEKMRNVALDEGACGVKLSGAGMGGCLVALTRTKAEAGKVLKAVLAANATHGWICRTDEGARIDAS